MHNIDELIKKLESADADSRREAANALSAAARQGFDIRPAISRLAILLGDKYTRVSAAFALQRAADNGANISTAVRGYFG